MKFIDYYKVMGVAEDASAEQIKRAYRRLARKYHPDVSQAADAEERFKELGEAYEVLRDPDKRAEYDQLRRLGARSGEEFRPPPGWQSRAAFGEGGFTDADAARFSDFFEAIFGGRRSGVGKASGFGRGSRFSMRGEDIHDIVEISLEESYAGGNRNLRISEHRIDADGRPVPATRSLNVRIPKGVTDGQRIRLRGQGGQGSGGAPNGDLYLEIRIKPHPRFTVDGRDVGIALPVAPWETALGANVRVPTLGGDVDLNIPANARSGQKLRLKGRGLPGDPPGDQFVILQIVMPPVTSERQRELLRQLRHEMPFDPRREFGATHDRG